MGRSPSNNSWIRRNTKLDKDITSLAHSLFSSCGMYGTPPSLSNLVLGDNLENTTDFRDVYATLIERWLGADAAKVLGKRFTTLDMFRG